MVKKRSANFLLGILLSLFLYISGCQPASLDISPPPTNISTTIISPTASPTNQPTPSVFLTASPTIPPSHQADVMIFTAHPDDETLCCATVIQQALARGKSVHIVIFTNGDGWNISASLVTEKNIEDLSADDYITLARVRQKETLDALSVLGLNSTNITFLGYPDGGLEKIYHNSGNAPYTHQVTMKNSTYGPIIPDYHSSTYGSPAMYLQQDVLRDVSDLIEEWEPKVVYVHNEVDPHPDHQAVFWFVRDAFESLNRPHYVFTFCDTCVLQQKECPEGLICPAPNMVLPTEDQARTKNDSLMKYRSQLQFIFTGENLSQIVKEFSGHAEAFWPQDLY